MRIALVTFWVAWAAGCGSDVVTCADDSRCVRAGAHGSCLSSPSSSSHFCVFVDASCPNGQRWDRTAGDGLSRQCVSVTTTLADMSSIPPQSNGSPCNAATECQSGFCVDGVCCDSDCSGDACRACNVSGNVGACTAIPNGTPPAGNHPGCGPDDKSTCKRDGTCDGKGACRVYQNTVQCAGSSCDAPMNTTVDPSFCDGAGTCVKPNARTCAPYVCNATAQTCYGSCTGQAQCAGTNSCTSGSCGPKTNGATCGGDSECSSSHCVKGICCDSACTGTCMSCNVGVNRGTCSPVQQGQPDPQGGCQPGTGADAFCSPGGCNGAGACTIGAATTVCRAASCDGAANAQTALAYCKGATCPAPVVKPCDPYRCGATACSGSCAGDGDCSSGYYCSSTSCLPKKPGQQPCVADHECTSGICTPQQGSAGGSSGIPCNAPQCTSNMVCCSGRTNAGTCPCLQCAGGVLQTGSGGCSF